MIQQVIRSDFLAIFDKSIPLETFVSSTRATAFRDYIRNVTSQVSSQSQHTARGLSLRLTHKCLAACLQAFIDNNACATAANCTDAYCKPVPNEATATVSYVCTGKTTTVNRNVNLWTIYVWGVAQPQSKVNVSDLYDITIGDEKFINQTCQGV